ncbi:ribosome maturation factor RimM [Halofilum ochraceum]|uniref:ribosome maturation factor RimM n=1 Tax=Halofilum ochraceum TaxID=1611323 RepID=UPI0008DAB4E6|nr:ribosome maturation factor RimM [Halofilum ochraceum]
MSRPEPVTIGRIGTPRGVRGEVRVQSFARPPESILDFPNWWVETGEGWEERAVESSRIQSNGIVVALEGCRDRESAAALRHAAVAVPRAALPEPAPGEYYWHDLIGLSVATTEGEELGRVDHLLETGANDVLVVHGDRERLIPWIQGQVVQSVDLPKGRMIVDWDPTF